MEIYEKLCKSYELLKNYFIRSFYNTFNFPNSNEFNSIPRNRRQNVRSIFYMWFYVIYILPD